VVDIVHVLKTFAHTQTHTQSKQDRKRARERESIEGIRGREGGREGGVRRRGGKESERELQVHKSYLDRALEEIARA
jgi:hypothetical protein